MRTSTVGNRWPVRSRRFAVALVAVVALVVAAAATARLLAVVPAPVLETLAIVASWYVGMAVAFGLPFAVRRLVAATTARG
jgi:hypothetical protein